MQAFINYITFVIEDGDWLNDWLTHIPETVRLYVRIVGYILAKLLELGG